MRLIDADNIYSWYMDAFDFDPNEVRFSINDIRDNLDNIPSVPPTHPTPFKALGALDCVDRQAAIDGMFSEMPGLTFDGVLRVLRNLPSAQTDIIACGDCKHWICHDKRCGYWNHGVKPLDWCCHAERRTDG